MNVSKADIEKIKSHIEINQDIKNEIKQPEEFDEEFAMSKAGFYFKIKNYSKSVEYLDRILEKDPKNIHALFRKGLVLKNEKKDAEAIIYLDLALEIKKGKEIEIQKMICLNNLKKHNEALEIANGILHENPKDYDILHKKGIILNDMDKFSEARKIFSKCLEKNSKNIRVMTSIATSYMREQKLQEAVSTLEGILEIEPKNIRSLIRLTHLKETLWKEDEAIKLIDRVLKIQPDNAHALKHKGEALTKLEKYDDAILIFDLALKFDDHSTNPDIITGKGVALKKMGKYEESLNCLNVALEKQPMDAIATYHKACVFSLKGRKIEALDLLETAIMSRNELKKYAVEESDFKEIQNEPKFKEIVE